MSDLPSGTVTFLLTDVEGSTRLWERDPQVMHQAMARHDAVVEACIERHGGMVVRPRGEGDSRFAVFPRATDAVAAGGALQRALHAEPWATSAPVRVRIALHTGEGTVRAGDYYGPAPNRCARLRALAQGGQVLVSAATKELVQDTLPEGVSLRSLGVHRLKDLQRPEEVFQLLHPALPAEFLPLRSLDALSHNLPIQLSSFIGRQRELAEVKRRLASTKLLTLTGAGGCGKSRLALQVAAELLEDYADGVWLVELAPLSEPSLVPEAAAVALGVREEPGRPLLTTLSDYLRPKRVLLVLDNCEHLLPPCASLTEAVLQICPHVRILATSRESLGITGEVTYRVPSMSLPDLRPAPSFERLMLYDAVRLFVDRATLAQPEFAVTARNAPALAQVCRRLDGIPLAIELAAARAKVLSAEQIADRLDDRFRLLTAGSRVALPRHQTLRAAIDWSYGLLSEQQQRLLRRLSVFAGGWTLEAAETVCAGDGVGASEILDLLARLTDKSLVLFTEDVEARYRLLETVRQYSWEKLVESREPEPIRDRDRNFFTALAERAEPGLAGAEQMMWLERLEVEHGNLMAAMGWSLERNPGAGLRLAAAVWRFWEMRGYLSEGRQWLDRLLRVAGNAASGSVRAKALNGAGALAQVQGDHRRAVALHEEALALRRELGDRRGTSQSLANLGAVLAKMGDYSSARSVYEQGLTIDREMGDARGVAVKLNNLGTVISYQGDYEMAHSLLEQSLAIKRELGDKRGIAVSLNGLGFVALHRGDFAMSHSYYAQSLAISRELGNKMNIAASLEELAGLAATRSQFDAAARLFGAAANLREDIGARLPFTDRATHDRNLAHARAALGEEAFAAFWAEGRAMTLEQAIEYALEEN